MSTNLILVILLIVLYICSLPVYPSATWTRYPSMLLQGLIVLILVLALSGKLSL